MSVPEIAVVHVLDGRARLRAPNQRGDAPFFERVARVLPGATGVVSVKTNALTGSILVVFENELDEVLAFAEQEELFKIGVVEEAPKPRREDAPPWADLFDELVRLDNRLRSESDDRWGLGSLTFYAMLAACAFQIKRGSYFPAASSLLVQARGILKELNQKRSAN